MSTTVSASGLRHLPTRRQRVRAAGVLLSVAYWVLLPIFAAGTLAFTVHRYAQNVNSKPAGIVGTLTVTYHGCSGAVCEVYGTFRDQQGAVVQAELPADTRWNLGEVHPGLFNGTVVSALPTAWDPTPVLSGMIGSSLLLLGWGYLAVHTRREHRRAAAA